MNFGKKSLRAFAITVLFLSAGLGLCATGCQSFKPVPPSGSIASVTITNRFTAEISSAVQSVFASSGFQGGRSGANQYTYEHPGSRANNLAYGNYFFDEPVVVRVTVTVAPLSAASTMVSCKAWLVESANARYSKTITGSGNSGNGRMSNCSRTSVNNWVNKPVRYLIQMTSISNQL